MILGIEVDQSLFPLELTFLCTSLQHTRVVWRALEFSMS